MRTGKQLVQCVTGHATVAPQLKTSDTVKGSLQQYTLELQGLHGKPIPH